MTQLNPANSRPVRPNDTDAGGKEHIVLGMPGDGGILVTGLPRSGTSWVGKMLQAGGEVVYVNEPLNPSHPPGRSPGVLNANVTHRYQYICAENEERWVRAFSDTLRLRYHPIAELRRNHRAYDLARVAKYASAFAVGKILQRRTLIDDPFAVFSSAWFAERAGCQVIVCVRHPFGFVGSWRQLGWKVPFGELLDQPLLMRDLLGGYADEMRAIGSSADRIARTALLWRITYAVLDEMAARTPRLHVRRYEDLARAPEAGFRELYETCGLAWTERAQRRIVAATSSPRSAEGSFLWSLRGGLSHTAFRPMNSGAAISSYQERLTPHEIRQVWELTSEVAKLYYEGTEYDEAPKDHEGLS
jgi:hypothetical protein